ncbi:Insecticidal toxin complex protein TcaA2 [Mycoavidus cysteinexigens]|uniref:Insecticidal toxin complex protein TcaA2 n=1 Tax=Mycoavidus cysteinexigens TaxID=1553431 RepID=A0A2Z6EY39_9BURK|nr:Tc toxin subunit A [Mycoavidus cysteinexigens]BBE10383.1 Insecticidal toxin complex protein TcaA2 [Mycoavidus cysteinexigens]GAM53246.1 putative insecticidal toxin complex protein TccA [bacterium endosymbiont of Mortierella elongata FMR23-6]GLR00452.1 hypothetical protein GCM10007934_02630 [Mycoavidus cysteinexigens]
MMENKKSSPLLAKLAAQSADSTSAVADARSDFAAIMAEQDYHSVFDIIRQPKSLFVAKLREAWEGDAELAYDNAMCYAIQIARLFREQQLSSDHMPALGQRSGVRGLVEVGPTYANLFKENWDTFCKVGALEAIDSPVFYLTDIYRWAKKREDEAVGDNRIRLDVRRPDLPGLLIDHQSTHQPIPALQLANKVVADGIKAYLDTTEDKDKSIYAMLAAKRFPFLFPYNYPHHQVTLGLENKKIQLGALNYRARFDLPLVPSMTYPNISTLHAQIMLSELGPEQQKLFIQPSLFTTYYLTWSDIHDKVWGDHDTASLMPWNNAESLAYIVPPQAGATGPDTTTSSDSISGAEITLEDLSGLNAETSYRLLGYHSDKTKSRAMNSTALTESGPHLRIPQFKGHSEDTLENITSSFIGKFWIRGHVANAAESSYTLVLNPGDPYSFYLTEEGSNFFKDHYDTEPTNYEVTNLASLPLFLEKTGLTMDEVDQLMAFGQNAPTVSPNCPPVNGLYAKERAPFPASYHYGAVYVNAGLSPALGLVNLRTAKVPLWSLTNTSLDRFDRLQRMIRLQKWLQLPFEQIDCLIIAACRAEGQRNLAFKPNANTLRALGVFRYLNQHYKVAPDIFAAFLHHISPYSAGENKPLFDRVFNSPVLFETPLILDQGSFEPDPNHETSQPTIQKICAALGLQATQESYGRLAQQTCTEYSGLKRDLDTLSSLYRQTAIPKLFGLSAEEGSALLDLLGGPNYIKMVAKVELNNLNAEQQKEPWHKDILDILMELDWAVRWLKEAKLTVPSVRKLLGYDVPSMTATPNLIGLIQELHMGISQVRVTQHLFTRPDLPALDWLVVLETVIDGEGLVMPLPLELDASSQSALSQCIKNALTAHKQTPEVIEAIVPIFVQLIGEAQASQENLVAAVLNKSLGLAYDRTALVLRWAGSSVHDLLTKTLAEVGENSAALAPEDISEAYIAQLYCIARHAEATTQQKLSAALLRMLLVKPKWLGIPEKTLTLSFACLYLLNRYQSWWERTGAAEDEVLSYFQTANLAVKANKKTAQQAAASAATLARLLVWTTDEVTLATKDLPDGIARTLQQVDWVRRLHDLSQQTGLSVRALQQAAALTANSSELEWKQAGEAMMAAVRASQSAQT